MKRKALFVGINDYEGGLVPLNCACKDANDLCDYFRDVLRYDTHVLRNADILEVRKKINEVTKDLQRGDVFLFFFAGHGFTVDKGGDTDRRLATARDPKDHLEDGEGGISLRRLRRLTKGGYSRVFILDACQTKINAIRAADDVEKKTVSKRDLSIISSIVKTANEVDDVAPLWVINSCNIGDVAYELENNGLFTWAFIETLTGLRESGEAAVFNEDLVSNIANKMRMHPGRFNQTPVFFASDEETPEISVFGDALSSVDTASMAASSLVLCPICGKKNLPADTFRCRECGSDNLCLRHQDEKTFLCFNCAEKTMQKVVTVVPESRDIKNVKCADIPVQTFKNATVHPECHLLDEELDYALVKGKDYVVQYEDADSPGFATAVITGIGKYRGERRVLFEIKKEEVQEPLPLKKILCNQFKDYIGVYDGKAHSVSPSDNALADASGFKCAWYNKNTGRWDIEFPKYVDVCDVSLRIKIEATGYLPRIECRRIKIARRDLADSMVKKAAVVRSATGELLPDIVLKDRRPCVIRRDDWEVLECDENHIVINGKRNYSGELDVRLRGEERNDIGNGEMEIVPLKPSELASNVSSLCCNIDSVDEIEKKRECKNLWPLVFFWIVGILSVQGGLMIVGIIVDLLIGVFVESVLGISHMDYPQREITLWCAIIVPTIVTVLGALLLGLGIWAARKQEELK